MRLLHILCWKRLQRQLHTKRIFGDNPIIFYAIWDDAAQPTEKLNYTTRQHYIDEKGNGEVATVDVGGVDLLACKARRFLI